MAVGERKDGRLNGGRQGKEGERIGGRIHQRARLAETGLQRLLRHHMTWGCGLKIELDARKVKS